ncbi:MAG TPA: acyl-CoA carboxylase epsilon subunit [Motilibacterales bacterium]|nr:acyl-CoA carboxylase epsilon subunit [Motilibacterales bacterium]
MSTGPESEHRPPALRIVRGEPTPEEIAALVTVLAAASGGDAQPTDAGAPVAQWAPPHRLMRPDVSATGWWESSLPR